LDYIIYKGIDSRSFGVYLVRRGGSPLVFNATPPSRTVTEQIAGRHGTIVMEQTYEPRQIDVTLYISNSDPNMLRKIARWLGSIGTYELYIPTEPYKVYNATVETALNPNIHNIKQGMLTLTFTCYDPFGYSSFTAQELEDNILYNTGLMYNTSIPYYDSDIVKYTFTGAELPNIDIYHGGNADFAMPEITIVGSGTNITIERYSDSARTNLVEACGYGSFNGTLEINSRLRETFLNTVINNNSFTGDYFTLKGIDDVSNIISGNVISISQTSAELDFNASAVDDIYNGKVLIIIDRFSGETVYKTISDYNGATKVASFSTTEALVQSRVYDYMVYDFLNELNYFRITGTGLSITSVEFDFRYVYL